MRSADRRLLRKLSEMMSALLEGELPTSTSRPTTRTKELLELSQSVDGLVESLRQANGFINALAAGNLDTEVPPRNFLVSPFKSLHSSLRHLTWQTEQIAKGHLTQQVDFLGDFSRVYNAMLESMREKKRVEEALHENERLLSNVFAGIRDGIIVIDKESTIVRANPAVADWYSDSTPLVGKKCYQALHNRSTPCEGCPCSIMFERGEPTQSIFPRTYKGSPIQWIDRHTFPLIDRDTGETHGAILYLRDVTERKNAEDQLMASLREKEVLMREIHHRVKNNFQVVSGIIALQAGYLEDAQWAALLKDTEARIRAMAYVYEKLYESDDLSNVNIREYLTNIILDIMAFYSERSTHISLSTDIEGVSLDVDTAVSLGLIITELITNSIRHAFVDRSEGKIVVRLQGTAPDEYELFTSDNGSGLPPDVELGGGRSLGLNLVLAFSKKIEATIQVERSGGTQITIKFRDTAAGAQA
ncbi:sensor histidine kinase [Thermodesulfobacteriota bacterium]